MQEKINSHIHRNARSAKLRKPPQQNYKWYETEAWENFADKTSLEISNILGDKYVKELNILNDKTQDTNIKMGKRVSKTLTLINVINHINVIHRFKNLF